MTEEFVPDRPPAPGVVTSWDDIADALGELREWAGLPSYALIASGIRAARLERGVPQSEAAIGRVTVYDYFRHGRRRVDVDLVVEIARALGASERQASVWRQATRRAMSPARALRSAAADVTLPGAPTTYVGRRDELRQVLAADGPTFIGGLAGSGKSALALTAAQRFAAAEPDSTALYVDLLGAGTEPADPQWVLREFLRALGADPDPADRSSAFAAAVQHRSVVLVLDNAASAEQLAPLLPATGSARVIVTSRHALPGAWSASITLSELPPGEAVELLTHLAARTTVSEPDRTALSELSTLAGGLPLALTIVANRLRTHSDWPLSDHVQAYRERLDLLRSDADLVGALSVSVDALSPEERRCFLLCALHPGADFSADASGAMLDLGPDEARREIERLEDRHLVRAVLPGRWSMHDLVRSFGARHAVSDLRPAERNRAMERLLHHYLDDCVAAVAATKPHAVSDWFWLSRPPTPMEPPEAAHRWFDQEYRNVAAAVSWAAEHRPELAVRLAAAASWPLWDRADLDLATAMHRTAVQAAESTGDLAERALALRLLGLTLVRAARFADAQPLLERSAALHRESGDLRGEIASLNGQAIVATITGRYDEAMAMLEHIVAYYEAQPETAENADRLCVALGNLAVARSRSGDHGTAIDLVRRALEVAVAHGRTQRELNAQSNLSEMLAEEGRFAEAETAARRALELARAEHDEITEIYALTNLSTALAGSDQMAEALRLGEQALAQARAADAPDTLASVLNNRADQLVAAGTADDAHDLYTEALSVATGIGEELEMQRAADGLASLGAG